MSALIFKGLLAVLSFALCSGQGEQNLYNAFRYLFKFGYTNQSIGYQSQSMLTLENMEDDIKTFQRFAGLRVTGELNEETMAKMQQPRCGVKDIVGKESYARRKRFALQGSKWRVRVIKYRINNFPKRLNKARVKKEIAKAFKVWSDVTPLKFIEIENATAKVHIDMSFEKGEHGDGDPFDGPGKTLAHAYFPIYGGDVHFDTTEPWSIGSYSGTDLLQVTAHELGHSLGLSHSDTQSALMAPFYRGYQPNMKLDKDDLLAIRSLYGEPDTPETTPSQTTEKPESEKPEDAVLCKDSKFDAIVRVAGEMDCVFKGTQYWKLNDDGIAQGFPREISDDFPGVPDNIDAAFSWNEKTYFFKGDSYWRITNYELDSGFPKPISQGFKGIPNDIDAAFIWSGNAKAYFFKGSQYWKFDSSKDPPVDHRKYPRNILNWGIPNNIDGAFLYEMVGKTYFFKGDKYWKFDDLDFKVAKNYRNPYPRSIKEWWFGCEKAGIKETDSHQDDSHDGDSDADAVSG